MEVINGFLITRCRFIDSNDEKLSNLGIKTDGVFEDFRIKISDINAWNVSDDGLSTTIRTWYDTYSIDERIEDIDKLMLGVRL